MKRLPKLLAAFPGSAALLLATAGVAVAQTPVDPSQTPVQNAAGTGPITPFGIHTSLAAIFGLLGVLAIVLTVFLYMRYAPRFARDEETKLVRADRVQIGQELPRRNVDISKAAPVVVAPPPVPVQVGATAPTAPTIASVPQAVAASVSMAPTAVTTPAAPAPASSPEVPAAATTPVSPALAAAPAATAERHEVTMDQDVFERTLKELLDAGTDRRIAEGRARRAGMIAAKKAAGEA